MSLSTDFIQLIIIMGRCGVVFVLCCSLALCATGCAAFVLRRYRRLCVASLHRPTFRCSTSLCSTREYRRVACCGLVRYATHPCTSRHTKHHSRGLPLAKCLAFSVQLATLLIYTLRHLTKYLHAHATIHTSHR